MSIPQELKSGGQVTDTAKTAELQGSLLRSLPEMPGHPEFGGWERLLISGAVHLPTAEMPETFCEIEATWRRLPGTVACVTPYSPLPDTIRPSNNYPAQELNFELVEYGVAQGVATRYQPIFIADGRKVPPAIYDAGISHNRVYAEERVERSLPRLGDVLAYLEEQRQKPSVVIGGLSMYTKNPYDSDCLTYPLPQDDSTFYVGALAVGDTSPLTEMIYVPEGKSAHSQLSAGQMLVAVAIIMKTGVYIVAPPEGTNSESFAGDGSSLRVTTRDVNHLTLQNVEPPVLALIRTPKVLFRPAVQLDTPTHQSAQAVPQTVVTQSAPPRLRAVRDDDAHVTEVTPSDRATSSTETISRSSSNIQQPEPAPAAQITETAVPRPSLTAHAPSAEEATVEEATAVSPLPLKSLDSSTRPSVSELSDEQLIAKDTPGNQGRGRRLLIDLGNDIFAAPDDDADSQEEETT